MSNEKPHHHGNLRQDLVSAGIELMEEGGIDAMSLRKCAARAGVSHAAPAHHFNGIISLKAAIVARGHALFCDSMSAAMEAAQPDPLAQLKAICTGYIDFSQAHNAVFKFMFQQHPDDISQINPWVLAELDIQTAKSYRMLQDACAPFKANGQDDQTTEVMVWSLVHGYAMLFSTTAEDSTPGGAVPDFDKILPMLKLGSSTDA